MLRPWHASHVVALRLGVHRRADARRSPARHAFRLLTLTLAVGIRLAAAVHAGETPRPQTPGLGQLVVQDPQSESPTRLNVARYHVHLVLQPPVALVQIDQSFYNPYGSQQEGTFVFNLPRGASVSRFAMYTTPTLLVEGELIERQQAANVYQTIVNRRRDPAILEQLGDNLFRMRVFPIPAHDVKRILLDYTVPLEAEEGWCRFQLPLLCDLQPVWDFQLSGVIKGNTRPESVRSATHPDVRFEVQDQALTFRYPKRQYRPETEFAVQFQRGPQAAAALRSYVAEPLPRPAADQAGDPWAGRTAMYFMATVPPLPPEGNGDRQAGPGPADLLILADTSSGMRGCPAVRQTVQTIIQRLRREDRFRLVCVDVDGRPLHAGWLAPDTAEAAAALKAMDEQFPLGGTDLAAGFRDALAGFDARGKNRRVAIYVGDGQDTLGALDQDALLAALTAECDHANTPLFSVAAGGDRHATPLLARLAEATGGRLFDPAARREGNEDLHTWLKAGLPTGRKIVKIEIDGVAAEDLFYPKAWLPGRELHILGRRSPAERVRLRLTVARSGDRPQPAVRRGSPDPAETPAVRRGSPDPAETPDRQVSAASGRPAVDAVARSGDRPQPGSGDRPQPGSGDQAQPDAESQTLEWELQPTADADDVFVGRLWGQRQLERLRYEEARHDARSESAQRLRQQTIRLSREWSLLSPHTAFLVLESEADYRRWNIDRLQRRRYWRPAEALPQEPLPVEWLKLVTPDPVAAQRERETQRLAAAIKSARTALAAGNHTVAYEALERVCKYPAAAQSPEYLELSRQARAAVTAEAFVNSLGPHRRLFAPNALAELRPMPDLTTLLTGGRRAGPDFVRRHPHYQQLQQPVDVPAYAPRDRDFSLDDLVNHLRRVTQVNVIVDAKTLDQIGLDPQTPLVSPGCGRMSLRNCTRFLLQQLGLVLIEEPYRLLITTPEEADTLQTAEVYPVGDLMRARQVAGWDLLVDPYLDGNLAAADRLRAKLQRPVSVAFRETPLQDVLARFAALLDDTVLLDRKGLGDIGVADTTPVTATWRDVPAKLSLQWILDLLDLAYYVDDEALVITSREQVDQHMTIRLHSGRGIVDVPGGLRAEPPLGPWGAMGMGGMSGMGGGMAGFGGGLGGGGATSSGAGGLRGMGMGGLGGMGMGGMALGGTFGGPPSAPFGVQEPGPTETAREASGVVVPDGSEAPLAAELTYDVDGAVDLITNTIAPQTWDSVGGPGSIEFFPPTMDLVMAQTDEVHEQVQTLLARLRRLPLFEPPPAAAAKSAPAPAGSPPGPDMETLVDLITTTVLPQNWSNVGGAGSIEADWPHAALIVSQTADGHDAVSQLLTLLRRSRYEAVRGTRPWQAAASPDGPPLVEGSGIPAVAGELRRSQLPAPQADELATLQVRRVPAAGRWRWRRVVLSGGDVDTIAWRQAGGRLEVELPGVTCRTDEDQAATYYPGFALVELGNWGEAARQAIDTWLPWLPHRSNDELARWFDVRPVAPTPADREAKLVRFRLIPPGQGDSADTYVELSFSSADCLPHSWESYLQGKLTGRLCFADAAGRDQPAGWRIVTLEDAAGKPLVRWELLEAATEAGQIPAVADGWPDCPRLDRRAAQPAVDAEFHRVLETLRQGDWPMATAAVESLLKQHPQQPVLLLLRVWCQQHDSSSADQAAMVKLLEQIAAGPAPGLTRLIAENHFPWLDAGRRYAILSHQPAAHRAAEDWDHLAQAAMRVGRLEDALQHATAALERGQAAVGSRAVSDPRQFARRRTRIQLLFRLGRTAEAKAAATECAALPGVTPDQRANLAQWLAAFGEKALADEFFAAALAGPLDPAQRAALTRQRADAAAGQKRWRLLLESAALYPAGSAQRQDCLSTLTAELQQPADAEVAGTLADETQDLALRATLWIRQAELTAAPDRAGEIAWKVFRAGQLTESRLAWAYQLWNRARQWDRTQTAAETWLRSGQELSAPAAQELAAAYRAAHRASDARRAATRDPEDPPPAAVSIRPSTSSGMGGGFF